MPKKLYEEVLEAEGIAEALTLAEELDRVQHVPLFYELPRAEGEEAKRQVFPGAIGVQNLRTGEVVATVGRRYKPVQHQEVVEAVLDGLEKRDVGIGAVTAYLTDTKMHCHIRFNEVNVAEANRLGIPDPVTFGILVINSHDGTTPIKAGLCGFRGLCNNGMVFKTEDLTGRTAKHLTGQAADFMEGLDAFLDEVQDMVQTWVADIHASQRETIEPHEADLMLQASGLPNALQERIWERLHLEVQEQNGILDRWTLYNAATHVLSHTTGKDGKPMYNQQTIVRHAQATTAFLTMEVPTFESADELVLRTWDDDEATLEALAALNDTGDSEDEQTAIVTDDSEE